MTKYKVTYGNDPNSYVRKDLHRRITKLEKAVERLQLRVRAVQLAAAQGGSDRATQEE